jgi:NAD(P)-dependent dehydrogenase (short-subunit alcohol dehydrogenase family)
MELNLTHKHVLITGGSKGIGLACAKVFLEEGCKVSLVSRNPATLESAKQ